VVLYELRLLGALGFGLDLARCAATGARDDLVYVSPRSAQAVSRGAGAPYADKLLPLPAFLRDDSTPDAAAIALGLQLSGHFLARQLLRDRPPALLEARARLVARFA
jgi:DNA repair protein RecO (recombination protein O)